MQNEANTIINLEMEYDIYLMDYVFGDIDTIIDTKIVSFDEFCKRKLKT